MQVDHLLQVVDLDQGLYLILVTFQFFQQYRQQVVVEVAVQFQVILIPSQKEDPVALEVVDLGALQAVEHHFQVEVETLHQ